MKINREQFLEQLEAVQPGLSSRDVIEQSSCYVFKDGMVYTYNDEIACSQTCDIGLTGAVRSGALLALLRKMPEEEIEITKVDGAIQIEGKRRKSNIVCESDIQLAIGGVEKPEKWAKLHEDFIEAIDLVQHCASSDDSAFALTCVHIMPQHVEACDNAQMTRVTLPTGIKDSILVRRDSIKHITVLGMTKFSETTTWIHFKNPAGLVLSCRRFVEEYHNLDKFIDMPKAKSITIPKGLADAADKASIFASESLESAQCHVKLRPGKLIIRGDGTSGWYREVKSVKYDGPELEFMIAPQLLIDISTKHNEAVITENRLKVSMGKTVYVSWLSPKETKSE